MPKKKKEDDIESIICDIFPVSKDSETAKHLKNAKREILLALKSLVELGLKNLDAEKKPVKKAKKVKLD